MKAVFRGGPKDRKRMTVKDGTQHIEVAKPVSTIYSMATHSPSVASTFETRRGRYSRTITSTPKGVYYFVWMGWDDEA